MKWSKEFNSIIYNYDELPPKTKEAIACYYENMTNSAIDYNFYKTYNYSINVIKIWFNEHNLMTPEIEQELFPLLFGENND